MGGNIELLQLNHPDSAVFPAFLFDWAEGRFDPYVAIDEPEEFLAAVDSFPGCVNRYERDGVRRWDLRASSEGEIVAARSNRVLRLDTHDREAHADLFRSTLAACGGDLTALACRPDLLPEGASYPLVGVVLERGPEYEIAALALLHHLLPRYPKLLVWWGGSDRVYDSRTFRRDFVGEG